MATNIEISASTIPAALVLTGTFKIVEGTSTSGSENVLDTSDPNDTKSNFLIQRDQGFTIRFDWNVNGEFARLLKGGTWRCMTYFDKIGIGETIPQMDPNPPVLDRGEINGHYTQDVTIPPNTLESGVYRVAASMQYFDTENKPAPITGFRDIGFVNIYAENSSFMGQVLNNGGTARPRFF